MRECKEQYKKDRNCQHEKLTSFHGSSLLFFLMTDKQYLREKKFRLKERKSEQELQRDLFLYKQL